MEYLCPFIYISFLITGFTISLRPAVIKIILYDSRSHICESWRIYQKQLFN